MTREDIIRMAREAGFANVRGGLMDDGELSDYWDCWPGQLERFFHLAYAVAYAAGADAEREACAKVCEETTAAWTQHLYNEGVMDCAKAIRARGEK